MKIFSQMKMLRNYLAYQIFASFAVTIAIILTVAIVLPNFDARIFTDVEENDRIFFLEESILTEQEYNLDEVFRRGLVVTTPNGFNVILLDRTTATISGAQEHQLNALRAFIFKANNPSKPLQRRFGNEEMYGPFVVQSSTRTYYQYFIKQVNPQRGDQLYVRFALDHASYSTAGQYPSFTLAFMANCETGQSLTANRQCGCHR